MTINQIISNIQEKHRQMIALALIGLAQGAIILTIALNSKALQEYGLPYVPTLSFMLFAPFFFQFNYNERYIARLTAVSIAIGCVLGACFYLPPSSQFFVWASACLIAYILMPFVQIHHQSSQLRFPYAELFLNAWNNIFIFLIALFFLGLFWLLLGLWAALFKLININFFIELFTSKYFIAPVSYTIFGIGLAIGKEGKNAVATLRNILLSVCNFLMPILIFISLAFVVSLVFFGGFQEMVKIKYSSGIFLGMLATVIFFFNGIYQDGKSKPPYPKGLRILLEVALFIMPIYAIYVLYAIGVRIEQYGLTPDRFWTAFWGVIAMCYTTGYAASVVMHKEKWMHFVSKVNTGMAAAIMFALLLTHTPILHPISLTASNQLHRLSSEKVDAEKFDYAYLYFKLGKIGKAYLKKAAELQHPKQDFINERIEIIKSCDDHWDVKNFIRYQKLFQAAAKGQTMYKDKRIINAISYDLLDYNCGKVGKELIKKFLTLKAHPDYKIFKQKIEAAQKKTKQKLEELRKIEVELEKAKQKREKLKKSEPL